MCDPVFFVDSPDSNVLIRACQITLCIQNIWENSGLIRVKWSCDYSWYYVDNYSWMNLKDGDHEIQYTCLMRVCWHLKISDTDVGRWSERWVNSSVLFVTVLCVHCLEEIRFIIINIILKRKFLSTQRRLSFTKAEWCAALNV